MATKKEAMNEALDYFDGAKLPAETLVNKYLLQDGEGNYDETHPSEMWDRLASEFARIEKKYPNAMAKDEIYGYLEDFKYIVPQGSPMYGIGNPYKHVSLSNCVVVESPEDNISSIFNRGRDAANLYKRRAGVGKDLSKLRPEGEPVRNAANTTSGAWSFADYYSYICNLIGQSGRRGALMLSMDVRHPDIFKFVTMKQEDGQVTGANVSVRMTDDFMEAVRNDESFELRWPIDADDPEVSRTIEAKELWDEIVTAAHDSAEPGLLMWDNIVDNLPAHEYMETLTTNPCGEVPLSANDSCRLISINLKHLVNDPFTDEASFDFDALQDVVRAGMRLNDDLVDLEIEALEDILENHCDEPDEARLYEKLKETAKQGRRTGLGSHGLADCLARLGISFDSDEAVDAIDAIYETFRNQAYETSVELARQRGPFPLWKKEAEKDNDFIQRLPDSTKAKMWSYGRRNISILTNAPTGSVSIVSQTSSGIEPVFRNELIRRRKVSSDEDVEPDFVDDKGIEWVEREVHHKNVQEYFERYPEADTLPDYFVTSDEIDYRKRIETQAAQQQYFDHSLSSCLAKDNHMVQTDDGLVYIEDIVGEGQSGFVSTSEDFQTVNHEGKDVDIDEGYINGGDECLKVEMNRGESIIGTPDHKVQILNESHEPEWVQINDLEEGDYVIGRCGLECFGNGQRTIGSLLGKFETDVCQERAKSVDIPLRVTSDLARILGYMLSDGSINENGIRLSQLRNNVVDDFSERIQNVFGLDSNIQEDQRADSDLVSVSVYSRVIRDYMEYLGVTRSCYTKTIPEVIFRRAGRQNTSEFIRGLTLDGHVSEKKVCVMTTTSKKLADEIQNLLNQYGILAGVYCNYTEGASREFPHGESYECQESWEVCCVGQEAAKFVNYIGFAEDRKQKEARSKFVFPSRKNRYGVVPDNGLRKRIRNELLSDIESEKLHKIFNSVTSTNKQGRKISRENLLFLNDLSDQIPEILVDETYYFSEVKEVSNAGERETFDLHVKDGNSYIANNLVSHNTINLPRDTEVDTTKDLYMYAWQMGLKGVTIYREGSRDGVLVSKEEHDRQQGTTDADSLVELLVDNGYVSEDVTMTDFRDRTLIEDGVDLPDEYLNSNTQVFVRNGVKYYLHFSYLPEDKGRKFPVACWIHTNNRGQKEYVPMNRAVNSLNDLLYAAGIDEDLVEYQFDKIMDEKQHCVRLGKAVSMALRHNVSIPAIVFALEDIEGDYVSSTLSVCRRQLKKQIEDGAQAAKACPECDETDQFVFQEGCYTCYSCGFTGCN